jgi:hypothetical protein
MICWKLFALLITRLTITIGTNIRFLGEPQPSLVKGDCQQMSTQEWNVGVAYELLATLIFPTLVYQVYRYQV